MFEFRAWDIKKKEYFKPGKVTGFHYYKDEITIWYIDDNDDGLPNYKKFHVTGIILEQYRGQKDKTGQKIYDGDLLTVTDGLDEKHINQPVSYKPEWGRVIVGDNLTLTFGIACKSKITGNIHEAPNV